MLLKSSVELDKESSLLTKRRQELLKRLAIIEVSYISNMTSLASWVSRPLI